MSTIPPPQLPPPSSPHFVVHYSDPEWRSLVIASNDCSASGPIGCALSSDLRSLNGPFSSIRLHQLYVDHPVRPNKTNQPQLVAHRSLPQPCTANKCHWRLRAPRSRAALRTFLKSGDLMAVRRLEARSPVAAVAVAGPREVEPTSTTDCGREINYSETGKCFLCSAPFV